MHSAADFDIDVWREGQDCSRKAKMAQRRKVPLPRFLLQSSARKCATPYRVLAVRSETWNLPPDPGRVAMIRVQRVRGRPWRVASPSRRASVPGSKRSEHTEELCQLERELFYARR